ncbi:MAG: polysaccharide deacetylase [Clostridia bacterium]|nr:polysaccharide deacetylase [Clostridia bacterium]
MATIDVETVGTTRSQIFKKSIQLALIFLAVFSVSCLISFAGGRYRLAKQNPKQQVSVTDEAVTPEKEATSAAQEGETPPASQPYDPEKVIYLTFDDGPWKYTEQLLDLLKKYDAKVTFFTTSTYPEYAKLMKREAEEGHTVAVHSYSHDYKKIYASSSAYWSDFEAQQKVIEEQTGNKTTLFRFPGGSSNGVSKFNPGIMTTLTQQSKAKGLTYFDWNVASADAGATTEASVVLQNCKTGVQNIKDPVILCHDVKDYTVKAMETFIPWAIENGYTFLPLTPDSPNAHHQVNN